MDIRSSNTQTANTYTPAHTHTNTHTHTHIDTHRHLRARGLKKMFLKKKVFKENLKEQTEDA